MKKIIKKMVFGCIYLMEDIVHVWHFHIHKQWRP